MNLIDNIWHSVREYIPDEHAIDVAGISTTKQIKKAQAKFMARNVHDINKWTRKDLQEHVENAKRDITRQVLGELADDRQFKSFQTWIKVPRKNVARQLAFLIDCGYIDMESRGKSWDG